jgi:hypothetical protein
MAKSTIVNVPVDELRPHPARALVPPLTAEEYQGLLEDTATRYSGPPLCHLQRSRELTRLCSRRMGHPQGMG